MEITGLGGIGLNQQQLNLEKQQGQIESFQSILDKSMESKDQAEIKKACVEFESYFLSLMFKEMRKTVDSSGSLIPKSNAEMIFQDMLDEETSQKAATQGGIGLADMMYKQLNREVWNG